MKIFSIGGIYISRGAPETIEKPPRKIKREKRQRRRDGEKKGRREREIMVVSLSLHPSFSAVSVFN
jgi:hypothetical protein